MSNGPQMFRVNLTTKEIQTTTREKFQSLTLKKVEFAHLGLRERYDLQEWIATAPSILGDDLLMIGKEFSNFDQTDERVDLVAVDRDGKLVVIELKRDGSDKNVHGQAIKYASYLSEATQEEIVNMLAYHELISRSDAETKLREHIKVNDLSTLNHDQRIILASRRFTPQVTSAVLWLNERAHGENLITCIQLTPHQDGETDSLYLKASTIIPGAVEDDYKIRIYNDEETDFLRKVGRLATDSLPAQIQPNETSQRAVSWNNIAYYDYFYSRQPWHMRDGLGTYYRVHLHPPEEETDTRRKADVTFKHKHARRDMNVNFDFQAIIKLIGPLPQGWQVDHDLQRIRKDLESDELNDDFVGKIADVMRQFIETITPVVDRLASENNS